jgi:hypothetical protein
VAEDSRSAGDLAITLCISSQIPAYVRRGYRVFVIFVAVGIVGLPIPGVILPVIKAITIALTFGDVTAWEVIALVSIRIPRAIPPPVTPKPPTRIDPRIDKDSRRASVPVDSLAALRLRLSARHCHNRKYEADHQKHPRD